MSPPSAAIARSAASRASSGVRSISTLALTTMSRAAAIRMIAATTSAATESPCSQSRFGGEQSREHRCRAEPVGGEVPGVRAQRRAAVAARGEQRAGGAADVERERDADHRELEPVDLRRPLTFDQVPDRRDRDDHGARDQDRCLADRAQVLGAPVAVGVPAIGGAPREPHREERQHSREHVPARLDAGGDQTEAVRGQAGAELQRDEQRGDGDRDERRAPRSGDPPARVRPGIGCAPLRGGGG